ncbi:MAG: STAS domain-containing protein [Alphaproteobacteria bacterium]|nr:STAS domain-containing protein [Alphaproteobacteria bacterium]
MTKQSSNLDRVIASQRDEILTEWRALLTERGSETRLSRRDFEAQCGEVLSALREAIAGDGDTASRGSGRVHDLLAEIAKVRAHQGFSARETASFIFSLKPALFAAIGRALAKQPAVALAETATASDLLDGLGLATMEAYQKTREAVIVRQQQEIAELSTPVVKLWQGILAVPLIGTLDSSRTQVVMENLLQGIVDHGAEIAIVDITGVPTVDTLVAQHLLKTVAAARLMGADCVISGIRPQIAQTMVHLGIELNVVSKATLAEALAYSLTRIGKAVVAVRPPPGRADPASL